MSETLIFTRADVAALLPLGECIAAVEDAFRSLGAGEVRRLPQQRGATRKVGGEADAPSVQRRSAVCKACGGKGVLR